MAETTTTVGRSELEHPDFNHDGGTNLHTKVRTAWTKLSDDDNSRFFTEDALADSASVDFDHNFKIAFSDLRVILFNRNTGTGELTRIVTGGTPDLDDFTIVATPGSTTTQVRVTNNTGSAQDIALVVVCAPTFLDDHIDVNLSTPPEDGQALVYEPGTGWVPGASGDSSFKIQDVAATGETTIKGGHMIDNRNRQLATYDGSGTAETDFFGDLDIDLDNLESSPTNDTTYYLYIDDNTLNYPITTDADRDLYGIQEANLVLLTTAPDATNLARYMYLGFVRRATAAWSTTVFGTTPQKRQDNAPVAVSPVAYTETDTVTGFGGATGTITHNKNIPVKDQQWVAFYDDGANEYQLDGSQFVTQKTRDVLTYDFSSLNLTDTVTVKLLNTGITPSIIPVEYFDRTFTSDPNLPASPIDTNLADVPLTMIIQRYDGVDWVPIHNVGDYIKIGPAPARQLRGDISSLSPSSANPIRIYLAIGAMALAVDPNRSQSTDLIATAYTAKIWDKVLSDTNAGILTHTLPPNPVQGDEVEFIDATGSWGSNNLTIDRNAKNINGAASNFTCDGTMRGVTFTYINAAQGWRTRIYA